MSRAHGPVSSYLLWFQSSLFSTNCLGSPLMWSRILLVILGRECFGPSEWRFWSFMRSHMNILRSPLIQERRNFSNLFVSIKLQRIIGGIVCNNCPTFWPGNRDSVLWYSSTNTRCQSIVLMNLAFLLKCTLCILPDYDQGWRQGSRLTSFLGVVSSLVSWRQPWSNSVDFTMEHLTYLSSWTKI